MKTLLVLILTVCLLPLKSQNVLKDRIGLNIIGSGAFGEVITNKKASIDFFLPQGVSYQHDFKSITLRTDFNYFQLTKTASAENCYDCYSGSGTLKGIEVKIGLQKGYYWRSLMGYWGMSAGYLNSKFTGKYDGGFFGQGYLADAIINRYELNPFIGVAFCPVKRLMLAVETGYKLSRVNYNNSATSSSTSYNKSFYLPVESVILYYSFK